MHEGQWRSKRGVQALQHALPVEYPTVRLRRQQLAADDHIGKRHRFILPETLVSIGGLVGNNRDSYASVFLGVC